MKKLMIPVAGLVCGLSLLVAPAAHADGQRVLSVANQLVHRNRANPLVDVNNFRDPLGKYIVGRLVAIERLQ